MSTTSAERPNTRKARAAQTRRRLVQAAVEQFSERHYDDVAVSDIAESAGVAHGLLFHYFDSKRGVYLEAMHEAARELDFVDTVPPDLPAGRQFRQYLETHVGYLARHRGLALRLVRGGRGSDPEAWEVFEAARRRTMEWLCSLLGLDPNSEAIQMMLRSVSAAFDEITIYWLEHGQIFDVSAIVDEIVALTITCLQAAERLDPSLNVAAAVRKLRRV